MSTRTAMGYIALGIILMSAIALGATMTVPNGWAMWLLAGPLDALLVAALAKALLSAVGQAISDLSRLAFDELVDRLPQQLRRPHTTPLSDLLQPVPYIGRYTRLHDRRMLTTA